MGAPVVDIAITKGRTFEFAYRYADSALVYKSITGMPSALPVRLTIPAHGIPDGWPITIEGVRQPLELNSDSDECCACYFATLIDPDTIELNRVNGTAWRPYTSGGAAVFHQPYDVTGHSARMQIRDRIDGTVLLTLSSDPASNPDGLITIDTVLSSIIVKLEPAITAAITWNRGVYDLELITPSGDVYGVTSVSAVKVTAEVTK